jgi:hypothetical protein
MMALTDMFEDAAAVTNAVTEFKDACKKNCSQVTCNAKLSSIIRMSFQVEPVEDLELLAECLTSLRRACLPNLQRNCHCLWQP